MNNINFDRCENLWSKKKTHRHIQRWHTTCSSAKKRGGGVPVVLIVIHGCCAWVIIIISLSIQGKESGRMLLLRLHKAELIWLNLSVYFFFFFIIIIIVIFFFFFSIYICSHCSSLQTLLCFSFIFVGNWSLLSITGDYTSQFSSLTTFKYNTGGGGGPKRKRRKENKNPDEQSRKSACAGRDPCWSRNKHRNPILFFFFSLVSSLCRILNKWAGASSWTSPLCLACFLSISSAVWLMDSSVFQKIGWARYNSIITINSRLQFLTWESKGISQCVCVYVRVVYVVNYSINHSELGSIGIGTIGPLGLCVERLGSCVCLVQSKNKKKKKKKKKKGNR